MDLWSELRPFIFVNGNNYFIRRRNTSQQMFTIRKTNSPGGLSCVDGQKAGIVVSYLRDGLADGSGVEIGGIAGVPLAEPLLEIELHEVAGNGGDQHATVLPPDAVVELEDLVVPRPPFPDPHPLAPRQQGGYRLRHRRLLRHAQDVDGSSAAGHRWS